MLTGGSEGTVIKSEHTIKLINCLSKSKTINRTELNRLIYQGGIPDEVKGLRPLIWRILLNYLPDEDTSSWND